MRAVRSGCEDGVEWVELEDTITGLGAMWTQCSKGRWGCYWMMEWIDAMKG